MGDVFRSDWQGANILGILAALIAAGGGHPCGQAAIDGDTWIGSLPALASIEPVTSEPGLFVDLPHTATTSALAAGVPTVGSGTIGYRRHHAPLDLVDYPDVITVAPC